MNYSELIDTIQSYADRYDDDLESQLPVMFTLVESRVSRLLKIREMTVRARFSTVSNKTHYPLPSDFKGMRDIKAVFPQANDGEGASQTLDLLNPEQMTEKDYSNPETNPTGTMGYAVLANQLQITPALEDGNFIEMVYYRRIPALTPTAPNNWLTDDYPDVYLRGMLAEVTSFAKDFDDAKIWNASFKEAVLEIDSADQDERWSGTPMVVKTDLTGRT